jgi:pyruvate/2-oxoglutarate/acetoin dehydrogenase E1 component
MRTLTYAEAINETLQQLIEEDERVVLVGQGVNSPWYVGSTTKGLIERFGEERLIDTPVSENAVTGIAVGAAVAGLRPILEHPRMDFMYLAMDQIANHAANWHFMFGGQVCVPLTIWGIINRGGEQAAQHSQALHSMFTHVPGLKVVMPSTPHDAKGLLVSCVRDDNPVLFVDDRWLYDVEGDVPKKLYTVPIGRAAVRKEGTDVTVIATSYMVHIALKAAQTAGDSTSVEVIDLRSLKPIDKDTVFESVRKTGRAVIVDGSWRTCGISAELSSLLSEHAFDFLKAPIKRVALPDTPAPASTVLEKAYYPDENAVLDAIEEIL